MTQIYKFPQFDINKFSAGFKKLARDKIKSFFSHLKGAFMKFFKNQTLWLFILVVIFSSAFGFIGGSISGIYLKGYLEKFNIKLPQIITEKSDKETVKEYVPQTSQEEAIIKVVKEVSPAVVNIIITKETPVYEQYYINPFEQFKDFFGPLPQEFLIPQLRQKGTQKKEIGGGTGLIISSDGLILTNRHVVADPAAEYTVFTNDGKEYSAKVVARDPGQDLAIIKIKSDNILNKEGLLQSNFFIPAKLGDSDNLQIGQTVIAIGNALGEFRNTVSVGVISGLGRTISASGGGVVETLEDVIQTDAAINKGNSGGPLLNLKGEVIGLNTAIATDAQSIGFAIPINRAKRDIAQVGKTGKIIYPFLGVRYVLINEKIKKENNLKVDYGALVTRDDEGEPAIFPDSPAEKAGIKEGDIILEFNGEKITQNNSLAKIISKYLPGDKAALKILRGEEIKIIEVVLEERKE
jgi:S1-C subfamily serine protease